MTGWSEGYMADIGYTFGYYSELNPLRSRLALLAAGIAPPKVNTACELGFGQGVSVSIHAAASSVAWHGTDFHPAQAAFAQELDASSGAGSQLNDQSFAEFCQRDDLPMFDYIGLHGIWSWVSDSNRAAITEFVRRRLNVGGVLYISYNTLPGWAGFAPMRHLMAQHEQRIGGNGGGVVDRIGAALAFSEQLLAANPKYLQAHPAAKARLDQLKKNNKHYLAHEYFNREWCPMYFSEVSDWLSTAKLDFACSAHYLDHIDSISLTQEQREVLSEIGNPVMQQTVRDFMVNQQFRKDYWVKGPRNLSIIDRNEILRSERVVLVAPRGDVGLKVNAVLGEVSLNDKIYGPILDALADNMPKSFRELEDIFKENGINLAQILEVMLVLTAMGSVAAAQPVESVQHGARGVQSLNSHLMQKARSSGEIAFLASAVTGGGVPVDRFSQMFLLGRQQGCKTNKELGEFAWDSLSAMGQSIIKDGATLKGERDNLDELIQRADKFKEIYENIYNKLKIKI